MKTTASRAIQNVWLNLPVKDLEKSKQFFRDIGFRENPMHSEVPHLGSFLVGEKDFVLMLFPENEISGYTGLPVNDTHKTSQMLINIDAQSKEQVDAFAESVKGAGGNVYFEPKEVQGWMYITSFADLDGHRWSMLYMDSEKMPTP
ncbi:VOC family protein [Galbibacter mesophilus]|uniref:VOC family protein n=1 Tax=Galbibacter mesophilus TaxID=379069 RepID=UPI0019201C7F|nr:VOC family protein [Galbibacter mesophilus]MCM5663640.1 VOC family protein [Galbibacter mesophilus]